MTANELADELDWMTSEKLSWWCNAVQNMLRQQTLEIQALHQILGYEGVEVGRDYLDECVAELRKASEK